MNVRGGTVNGYVDVSGASTVNISGAPTITGGATNLDIGSKTLTVGTMTGGSVGITATGAARAFTGKVAAAAYADYFSSDEDAYGVAYSANDSCLWLGCRYCVCGASKNGGKHVIFKDASGNDVACDGETLLTWLPWTSTNSLPTVAGNFYLVGNADGIVNLGTTQQSVSTPGITIRLDLNGITVQRKNGRAWALMKAAEDSHFVITDTAAVGGGAIVSTGTYANQGGTVWATAPGSSITLIRGELNGSGISGLSSDGAACIDKNTSFIMCGGTIVGGSAKNGGAVNAGGTVSIYDGSVTGGTAKATTAADGTVSDGLGGGFYVAGTLNIYGGTISGGTTVNGEETANNNIYVTSAGQINIHGGTISGYVDASNASKVNISGAPAITGGTTNLNDGSKTLTVGEMTSGANIWVTTTDAASAPVFGVASGALGTIPYAYKGYFHSDDTAYQVVKTAEGMSLADSAASHIHCACGGTIGDGVKLSDGTTVHHCCDVIYTALSDASAMASGGSYYLEDHIAGSGSVTLTGDVQLCLNGKNWTDDSARPLNIGAKLEFTLSDCGYVAAAGDASASGGKLVGFNYGSGTSSNGAVINAAGTLNMYGGILEGGYSKFASTVFIDGIMNLYGGTLNGGSTSGNGGNVRVNGTLNMYGGEILDGTTADQGGNLYIGGTANLYGGLISGGSAKNGGNITINSAMEVKLSGVQVTKGKASANGGNIRICSTATSTTAVTNIMAGTVISGGTAANNGGNISVETNNSTSVHARAAMAISGGSAGDDGANLYAEVGTAAEGSSSTTNLTISGGSISGYVYTANGTNITLSGAPVIAGGTSNLSLGTNTVTIGADLSKDANVVIACSDAANSRKVAIEVPGNADTSGITYQDGEYAVVRDGTTLYLAQPGAILNGNTGKVYALPGAIAAATGENDYVTLTADYTGDLTVTRDLFLDLNGCTITSDVTVTGGTLKLFDSATADYSTAEDANGKTYGKIVGNITGRVERTCNTPKATYGSNYRYLILKDGEGYHSHRIYMTVKSIVLYPATSAMNYRTLLRCDQVVAGYLNGEGGAYGIRVTADQTAYSDYTEGGILVNAYGNAGGDNELVTQLGSIIDPGMTLDIQKYNSEFKVKANAYILIPDQFYGEENQVTVSATVTKSLKELVQAADAMTDLNSTQKALLGVFYSRYPSLFGAESNNAWQLSNIPNYAQSLELKYYCLCGDKTSTNNPCAENGHKSLAWQAWNSGDSLPTEEGNWYLTGDVTLAEAISLSGAQFVCIDTQGHNITAQGRVAVVGDGAILNLVNSNTQDAESVISGVGEGSALSIEAGGNVSLYTGVTLTGTNTTGKGGVVIANGDMNIYGGTVSGGIAAVKVTEKTDSAGKISCSYSNGRGGNLYVSGTLELTGGTVTGGSAENEGGNVYLTGKMTVGNAQISNGQAGSVYENSAGTTVTRNGWGGNIGINGGEVNLNGVTVSGGTATSGGGNIRINSTNTQKCKLNITAGEISGGEAATGGNIHAALNNTVQNPVAEVVISGGTIKNGSAVTDGGNIHVSVPMTLSGGEVKDGKVENDTAAAGWGGNIYATGTLDISGEAKVSGGKVFDGLNYSEDAYKAYKSYGGNIYATGDVTISEKAQVTDGRIGGHSRQAWGGNIYVSDSDSLTMSGGTVSGGYTIYNSGNIHINSGAQFSLSDGKILGGWAVNAAGNMYVGNTTATVSGGEISGGRALIYTGGETNPLPACRYGVGGGIYVAEGELTVKGNAKIYDNYTGTVSGTPSAKENVVQDDSDDQYRYYNAITPAEENIVITGQSNVYNGGTIMTLKGLGGDARVGFVSDTLEGEQYEGTFAYADANYVASGSLVSDDGAVTTCQFADGRLYVPAGNGDTYLVGYGIADIQPELADLKAGMVMTNYGNERDTSDLYSVPGYYEITRDSEDGYGRNYFGGWDTKLYVTALATTDGEGDTVIIISADCSTFNDAVTSTVKRMVSLATGVPQDHISISCEHQHSAPGASVQYNEDGTIKTNYAKTFYTGVVKAAVAAMKDRQQSAVSVGTLDTTAKGQQYNFVRNVKLTFENGTVGMLTDNHKTHYFDGDHFGKLWIRPGASSSNKLEALAYTLSNATLDYESEVDTTMQLVRYTQEDGSVIVMANFQTHPHVGSGSNSCYVHSDAVGAFRHYLEQTLESGTETDYKVMYFSGAGGNVNTSTYLNGTYSDQKDSSKYPYANASLTKDVDANGYDSLQRLQKADIWGKSLASLAADFLGGADCTAGGTNKTVAMSEVTGGSKDVEVDVQTVTCTRKVTDASDKAVAKIASSLLNWNDGSYQNGYVNIGGSYENWYQYVGYSTELKDQVYSTFDAKRIRECLLWAEAGKTELDMTVTAYAMGEIGFVAAPYEMFQENGQQIKSGASGDYAMTIVATLANGGNGYVPSAVGYANGGYSTDNTRFTEGTGEKLVEVFVDMLKGLK